LLSRLGSGAGISKEDVEDACQEAVFWTLQAVDKFDQYRFLGPRTQRFQPFLDLVIKLRFANFARGVRRRRSHYSPLREQDAQARDSTSAVVEACEADAMLQDAVAALPDSLRDIVMGVSAGQSLHDLAEWHHVSDRTIRRRWQESRAILGTRLTAR
jgi:DNA-directed RNA polymerase specialized sigma24 family protein